MASTNRPGSPPAPALTPVSSTRSMTSRRAAIQRSISGASLTKRSLFRHLEGRGPRRAARAGRVAQQHLHLLFGAVEDERAALAQLHAFLERAQAVLEREVAALEAIDE